MATTETTRCTHLHNEDVNIEGSVIAKICNHCFESLPGNWGCTDCDWEEILEFTGRVWVACAMTCKQHRYLQEYL